MEILYWFESIRNPLLDAFFSSVTWLGHELIPIALICILYWCVNKSTAYKIGFSFFVSGLATQALKVTFRISRPWKLDPDFKPVENAVNEATSYSFPSGHTQSATSVYSSLALCIKKFWLRIILVIAFLLVGISRMYLGVHTLNDVLTALVLSLIVTLIVFRIFDKIGDNKKFDIYISLVFFILSAALIIYSFLLSSKGIISADSLEDCVKSGGAGIAFSIGYYIERKYINFDVRTKAFRLQIVKVVLGLGVALGLKSGLKLLIGDSALANGIRYFILVFFIVVIYPLIIKAFSNTNDEK